MPTRTTLRVLVTALLAVALLESFAHAQSRSGPLRVAPSNTPSNGRFDGWLLSLERGELESAYVCGQIAPFNRAPRWSLVGCGSGSGFLYPPRPSETDLAHFRTRYGAPLRLEGSTRASFGPGIGAVELQRGPDRSGLRFAPGRGPRVREASGPEVALEWRLHAPKSVGPFASVRARWDAGVAWIPDAPAVVGYGTEVVPFSTFTLNGRF